MNPVNKNYESANSAKVFIDHFDFIRKIIFFYIHDEHQADDMFQDFFISFISHPIPDGIKNIKSYLFRAIIHDIIDSIRHKEYDQNLIYKYGDFYTPEYSPKSPDEFVIMMEDISIIYNLIESYLPNNEAQAVYLQYRDNLNAKEIAEKMKVDPATIRGYVSKGLNRIRELLDIKYYTTRNSSYEI